ncbi:unnamed protein product [Ambrosiozyma monospora]|uniref:Unnamed protein product n=1 Tax=Ambrosiozyma monospora TaxID=43982 RepID=A0ACB5UCD2_AMBMO|nr:unnamed protein product [Ambrosiozyma monospora]
MIPPDLPIIDLPLQSAQPIGTEYEVINTINSSHHHSGGPINNNYNSTIINGMGNFTSSTNSTLESTYQPGISSTHPPYVHGLSETNPQGPIMEPTISSLGSWLKTTATDLLKAATGDDDWYQPRDIQVGQLMFGNSGNAQIYESSKGYGWLVDDAKDDYGILDNLKYVGDDNFHDGQMGSGFNSEF